MAGRISPDLEFAPRTVLESAGYAARMLREAIIAGTLRPGDRLIETDLAEKLQMSRHPVREAIRELGREGMVEIRPNRGAVVAGLSAADILEVYEMRAALGSLALRHLLLGDRVPAPEELASLEALAHKAMEAAAAGDQPTLIQHDLAFQAEIVAISGLPRAAAYFAGLGSEIRRFINVLNVRYPDRRKAVRREVMGLYEAIAARDHARAERIWQSKFAEAAECLVALLPAGTPPPLACRKLPKRTQTRAKTV